MTGGLMQLVAYGAQDIYLTGNPMITYFKVVYRRHTNFAMESIAQTFSGSVGFSNKVTALISRNGDLVNGMTLEATLPALLNATRWTDDVGHHLIKQVEVEIGGQLIDRHYADWLEIWAQLTVPASKMAGYREMIGQSPKDHLGRPNGLQAIGVASPATLIHVPLQFWFCRNVGLALPLIALQYHEVKVNITFNTVANLIMTANNQPGVAPANGLEATLWVDYIYLDTDERRRFAQVSHEYLIEQLQFAGDNAFTNTSLNVDLNFNHPVKELVWVARYADIEAVEQWSNYTNTAALTVANADSGSATTVTNIVAAGLATTLGVTAIVAGNAPVALTGTAVLAVAVVAGNILVINGVSYYVTGGSALGNAVTTVFVTGAVAGATAINAANAQGALQYAVTAAGLTTTLLATQPQATTNQNFTRPSRIDTTFITELMATNPVLTAILKLNGHDRFASRKGDYFNKVQTVNHHTNVPASPGINVYSFALKPEEHQPSGTCNFSRIDNAKLNLTLDAGYTSARAAGGTVRAAVTGTVKVFATNYNVLRIMSGMGGLAYSN